MRGWASCPRCQGTGRKFSQDTYDGNVRWSFCDNQPGGGQTRIDHMSRIVELETEVRVLKNRLEETEDILRAIDPVKYPGGRAGAYFTKWGIK